MSNKQDQILKNYYSERAQEYEQIYNRPDKIRLNEQKQVAQKIRQVFKNRYVLEIACGTGFWTLFLDDSAKKVLATDINLGMLEIANSKNLKDGIQFIVGDAYNPPISQPKFNGAMANFWFSHIPKKRIKEFLETLHSRLDKNSVVLIVDSVFREELGGELMKKAQHQDTFKRRTLSSGKKFNILKNYYSKQELENIFSDFGKKLEVLYLSHFWMVCYQVRW